MTILAAIRAEDVQDPVVETGYDFATAYDTDLHVLHAVSEADFEKRRDTVEKSGAREGYSKSQRADAAANVADEVIINTFDNPDFDRISTRGRVGEPVEEILDLATEVSAKYIVIGGRKRSPTGKALFGSTTQSILLQADHPVVTVMNEEA